MEDVIETKGIQTRLEKIEELERSVMQLQNSMHIIYELVEDHGQHLDTIEDMILESKRQVHAANEEIEEAEEANQYTYYMSSAVAIIAIIGFMMI